MITIIAYIGVALLWLGIVSVILWVIDFIRDVIKDKKEGRKDDTDWPSPLKDLL